MKEPALSPEPPGHGPAAKAGHGGGRVITYAAGSWHEGNPPVLATKTHAMWLGSVVFDGARSMAGAAPDLDLHCRRAIQSARAMGMAPELDAAAIEALARQGIARFRSDAHLYICPMFYAEGGFIVPDPATTRFAMTIYESPMPEPTGFSACLSPFRRPARDMAPTDAKASCLYPNIARAVRDANERGFDTGVAIDPAGNVAEFSYANLFMGRDGMLHTPAANGTFLNGITRQRVISLLREAGVAVVERTITFDEVATADELFCTSNYYKIAPCTRIEERVLRPGPLYARARALYMDFAGAKDR